MKNSYNTKYIDQMRVMYGNIVNIFLAIAGMIIIKKKIF